MPAWAMSPNTAEMVWPRPKEIETAGGESSWRLDPGSLPIVIEGDDGAHWAPVRHFFQQAEQRYAANIPLMAGAKKAINNQQATRIVGKLTSIVVSIASHSVVFDLNTRENYILEISPTSGVRIEAETVFGVLRGLQTFAQLVEVQQDANIQELASTIIYKDPDFFVSCIVVHDAPTFPYRGLLIDTSRHYLPIHIIEKILDAMVRSSFFCMVFFCDYIIMQR